LDQKFTTLTNLLTNNSNNGGHTGASYAEALLQNVAEQQPPPPNQQQQQSTTGQEAAIPQAEERHTTSQYTKLPRTTPHYPTRHEIDLSTWRPIEYRNAFNQQLRSAGAEEKIELAAVTLSRSGNIILTAKDGCTAEDLIKCRDHWMSTPSRDSEKMKSGQRLLPMVFLPMHLERIWTPCTRKSPTTTPTSSLLPPPDG
jgi:hypothetical protein